MKNNLALAFFVFIFGCAHHVAKVESNEDPYQWLEAPRSPEALKWVGVRNKKTEEALTRDPYFKEVMTATKAAFEADGKLPVPEVMGEWIYNFLINAEHPQGLWRRMKLKDYQNRGDLWENVLDVDALSKAENKTWVWRSPDCLGPTYSRCLLELSASGQDASEIREFDTISKSFVKDGFWLPLGHSDFTWLDKDSVVFAHSFTATDKTVSDYATTARRWKRGQKVQDAKELFKCDPQHAGTFINGYTNPSGTSVFITDFINFQEKVHYLLQGDGSLKKLDLPLTSRVRNIFKKHAILYLQEDWLRKSKTFKQGSIVAFPLENLDDITVLFDSASGLFPEGFVQNKNRILAKISHNVQSEVHQITWQGARWVDTKLAVPPAGNIELNSADVFGDAAFATYESFLSPPGVYQVSAKGLRKLFQGPTQFDASPYHVQQFRAKSLDGTEIPYYVVSQISLKLDKSHPTVMYGYGAGNISSLPFYLGELGTIWLSRGGVYVYTNPRGGGEFGPAWYRAALKENKHKTFEDFLAIAQDLNRRGFTSPEKLGATGGSWGGLLTATVATQYPHDFKAVVSKVPMTDMLRYPSMGIGSSWISEFGDPKDEAVKKALLSYSPYQNVRTGVPYPAILFIGATDDERCGPGHWRKMTAKLESVNANVNLYENAAGGHFGGANPDDFSKKRAVEFTFLKQQLMDSNPSTK